MLQTLISSQIDNAFEVFQNKYNDKVFEKIIRNPEKKIHVTFIHNNELYDGFRVQYNSILGPYKGGIRIDPIVTEEECTALAFWMTIKTSLFNLPYGGGKGGIKADFKNMLIKDQAMICQKFIKCIYTDIGPNKDIPAPDVGSSSIHMDIMNNEYKKLTNTTSNSTFTGKSIENGGIKGRLQATGYGVAFLTSKYVNKFMKSSGTYILQGYGNVGSYTSKFMKQFLPDYKLIAVADHTGYYYNTQGFDIDSLFDYNYKNKSLDKNNLYHFTLSKEEFFGLETDIIIPAALEVEITRDIASNLKCQLVVEGANGPLTIEADSILREKNIGLIPDILANSGGVIVSYFEWLSNIHENDTMNMLEKKLTPVFEDIYNLYIPSKNNARIDCYVKSLENIYKKLM